MPAPGTIEIRTTLTELAQRTFTVKTNQKARFVVPASVVRLVFRDDAGMPRVGCRYVLEVASGKREGRTTAAGFVEQPVPPDLRTARLEIWLDGDTGDATAFELDLGGLAPLDTVEGIQARLASLGFGAPEVNGRADAAIESAIREFQAFIGVTVTGRLDDAQRRRLGELHDRH